MKISKDQLKNIISEELNKLLEESMHDRAQTGGAPARAMRRAADAVFKPQGPASKLAGELQSGVTVDPATGDSTMMFVLDDTPGREVGPLDYVRKAKTGMESGAMKGAIAGPAGAIVGGAAGGLAGLGRAAYDDLFRDKSAMAAAMNGQRLQEDANIDSLVEAILAKLSND
jgi:hypothetical protein